MKLAELHQLLEAATQIDQQPEFQQLQQLAGEQVARDIVAAWNGDQRDYARSGGKNFEALVPKLLSPSVLSRKYGVKVTSELQQVLSRLVALAYHAMPPVDRLRATTQAKYANDVWGHERFARESQLTADDAALYESLKAEVALLTSNDD